MHEWIAPHLLDMVCLAVSILLFSVYHYYIARRVRRSPIYTMHGAMSIIRAAWVVSVMEDKKEVLAVQTLRNSTMAATFLASTAVLLSVGVLTMSGQTEKLGETWRVVNIYGSTAQSTLTLKLLVMLTNLFIAFFSFSMSIRLFNHVGFLLNAPSLDRNYGTSFTFVALQLNKAAAFFHIGMHAYYFLIPLVFWLFGPLLMVGCTVLVIVIVFYIERTPRLDDEYLSSFYTAHCKINQK